MNKPLRIFQILSGVYILAAAVTLALNGFSLSAGVYRQPVNPNPLCAALSVQLPENCLNDITDDLRNSDHLTWIEWQFLSNNRGYDQAHYVPVDIAALLLANSIVYLVLKIR